MRTAQERREDLKAVYREASGCTRCPQLAQSRTTVVFGSGNADADLMFVGEAPGRNEDEQGIPFVGQAGRLLSELLGQIGLERSDVFVVNVLKCRPPGNRDPLPQEIANCQDYLWRQLDLIEPKVVCTLGNFATKLCATIRPASPGCTGARRCASSVPGRCGCSRSTTRPPRCYTRALLDTLKADFARIPDLLAREVPEQPAHEEPSPPAVPEPEVALVIEPPRRDEPDVPQVSTPSSGSSDG